MRKAKVFNHGILAGFLIASDDGKYEFVYENNYQGSPVSLTMPVASKTFVFNKFPPFFDGLLPEGDRLEALLKSAKIDRHDLFAQIVVVGGDTVGSVTIGEEI